MKAGRQAGRDYTTHFHLKRMLVGQGYTQAHRLPKLPWNCCFIILLYVSCRTTYLQSQKSIKQGVGPTPPLDQRNLSGKGPSYPSQWSRWSTVFLFCFVLRFKSCVFPPLLVMAFPCEIKCTVPLPVELKAYITLYGFSIVGQGELFVFFF